MTKEQIEARLGKSAQLIEFTDLHFGIDHALFYAPLGEQNIMSCRNILVDYFRDDVKVGHASLLENIFQPSGIYIFKFEIAGNKYDVMADASYHWRKSRENYVVESSAEDKEQLIELLENTCRSAVKLRRNEIPFEARVNPVHYNWLASRHLKK